MLYRAILTAASVIALTATANAADMGSYKGGPASYASVNWSGLYGGVNAGYGDGTSKTTVEDSYVYGPQGSTTVNNGYAAASQSKSFDSSGGIGGGQIGYNVQNGRVVFGVEADLDASGITGTGTNTLDLNAAFPDPNAPITVGTAKGKSQLNYVGTLRGRVGYTFGNALVYATGGLAFGDATDSLTWSGAAKGISKSNSLTGYVLGAGTEYALSPAWSVKAEYQYIDLGSTSLSQASAPVNGYPVDAKFTADHTYNTVRVGLNYHVGAGFDPLK